MLELPVIPDNAPFTAGQRLWLDGFLAGYFARPTTGSPRPATPRPSPPAVPLPILFGSQTGTAEALARRLAHDAAQRGFAPQVRSLNEVDAAGLSAARRVVILTSTWGDGDPPDNAAGFWSWLSADPAPRLEQLEYAILGLGDRNYTHFCGASKKFDARLEALGARRLLPRGECDVDYESTAHTWIEALWARWGAPVGQDPPTPLPAHPVNTSPTASGSGNGQMAHGRSNPFPARLLKNLLLTRPGSSKEVRHYELSLEGSGLTYTAGDALGVLPTNCPALVQDLLDGLGATGTESVKVGEREWPLREALLRHLDITKPSAALVAEVARRAPDSELAPLIGPDREQALKSWLWGRGVIDLLRGLPQPPDLADWVALLRPLSPRLYSIASSPRAHPGEVHLTVNALRYQSHGRPRKGVASTFLADRVGDAEVVKVFVQPAPGFKPPARGDAPMIMIGPGTGIAPFRAFLEDRRSTGATGRNWLLFGDRQRSTDFLYESEVTTWHRDGFLTRLDLAFSRDQPDRVYVQHRLLEHAAELWSWLEEGAHLYVCGDAAHMAADVDAALHQVIERAGGRAPDAARAYVARLRAERRYQRDVY